MAQKKLIILFLLILAFPLFPKPALAAIIPSNGRWVSSDNYTEFYVHNDGQKASIYNYFVYMDSATCNVNHVRIDFPSEIAIDTNGHYSASSDILNIEGTFTGPNSATIKETFAANFPVPGTNCRTPGNKSFTATAALNKLITSLQSPNIFLGDLNNDNIVNIYDFNLLISNFGKHN